MIAANNTRGERSPSLIMLTVPVKKAAIPVMAAHIPGIPRYRLSNGEPLPFCPKAMKRNSVRKDKKNAAVNPHVHFPGFVIAIIKFL
jgi:hypothetical protein